jgi:5-methylcytosine-specific restriction endonuclease McrA
MFNNAILDERIVQSEKGNWIDLSGYTQNDYEWRKILDYFENSCSYCGKRDVELQPEHMIPQSNPKSSDRIYNICTVCPDCNKSKNNNPLREWYLEQEFCTEDRLDALEYHYRKYILKK